MNNYIRAEIFRHKYVKSHVIILCFTILFPILIAILLKSIAPYQDFLILGNHFLYFMYMYLLIGFYLMYPITICAHTIKPKYIVRQLLTSKMTKTELYISDIVYTGLINIFYIFVHTTVSIICSFLFFEIDDSMVNMSDSLTIHKFIVMMGIITLTTIFSNIMLYSLQLMLENKVLSTGIFLFIIYIIPLVIAQLRFFSVLIEKLSFFIPFLQVMLYYKGEVSLLSLIVVHIISFSLIGLLFLKLYNNKEE